MFKIQDLFSINSNALKDWLLLHFKKCRYVRCIFQINKIWQIKSKWATVRYNFFKFKQTKYNQLLNLGIQNGIYSSFGLWRPRKTNTVFSISNYTKAYWGKNHLWSGRRLICLVTIVCTKYVRLQEWKYLESFEPNAISYL